MTRLALSSALLATACGNAPTLEGHVVDLWGNSVASATVVIEGQAGQLTTDAEGDFPMPTKPGTYALKAGKDGFLQEQAQLVVTEDGQLEGGTISLYPRPTENGFWVVGAGAYTHLTPTRLHEVGNELARLTGVQAVEQQVETTDAFEVLFMSDARMDEIVRLGLELHRLDYKKQATLPGPLGPQEVDAKMYVASEPVEIDLQALRSKSAYRITTAAPLAPGFYAFHAQDLLDADKPSDIAAIPEAQRVAFPFEVR